MVFSHIPLLCTRCRGDSSYLNHVTWWRHSIETFSALLALCAGNSPATGEFPAQRPVTRSFDAFLELRLNKRLRKHSLGWCFEMPSRPLWRHCNEIECLSRQRRIFIQHNQWVIWCHLISYVTFGLDLRFRDCLYWLERVATTSMENDSTKF